MFFRVSHGFSIAISSLFDLTEYFISLLIKEGSRLGSEGLTSCLRISFIQIIKLEENLIPKDKR